MLLQIELIERTKKLCLNDDQLRAAMMYGSFAKGGGDQFSDIEFVLFFRDQSLQQINHREWLQQIAPVQMCYVNRFGITTVIFAGLVRGEFHFYQQSRIDMVSTWKETDWFPDIKSTLVVDKDGLLTPNLKTLVGEPVNPLTEANVQQVVDSFLNWYIFGIAVLARGEYLRSLDLLSWVQRNLLWMIRAVEREAHNWPTPSRLAEKDLSKAAYARYVTCSASAQPMRLQRAYANAWHYARELFEILGTHYNTAVSPQLVVDIESRIADFC